MTSHHEVVDRDLGGCPVMHRDFAPAQAAGCHWELADELRETSPVYFNTFAQGYMGFANGPHRCLGAHLARRELQLAVEEWLRVIPDFHVASDEELVERGGGAMMTLTSLPLAWEVSS